MISTVAFDLSREMLEAKKWKNKNFEKNYSQFSISEYKIISWNK